MFEKKCRNTVGTSMQCARIYQSPDDDSRYEARIPSVYKSNHASNLMQLDNGDILCVWFAGSSEGAGDIKIAISRLKAGDTSWSGCRLISDDFGCSEQNPFIYDFGGGRIWVVHTAQKTRDCTRSEWEKRVASGLCQGDYGRQETAEIRVLESVDYGETFSARRILNDKPGAFCRNPILKLSNGDLLIGIWYSVQDEESIRTGLSYGRDYSACMISSDGGDTWKEYPVPNSTGRVHMQPVEMPDGTLVAFFRSRFSDRIYRSVSRDCGRTWNEPEPTILPNNNASIQAKILKSGLIALVYNHTPYLYNDSNEVRWPGYRYPISLALSDDGGVSWPYIRHVDHGDGYAGEKNQSCNQEFSYPSLLQTTDGRLHVSYTCQNRVCIKHVIVDENWIRGDI